MNDDRDILWVVMVLLIVGLIAPLFVMPYFEAKSFNECTGGNASYMTALTTQLRVESCRKD